MEISERILHTESMINSTKNCIDLFLHAGQIDLAKQFEKNLHDLEKILEHERKLELTEAQVSGRKEWWHHPGMYFLIYAGGLITVECVKLLFAHL